MQSENQNKVIAVLDLGSNSFHVLLARVEHGEIRPLDFLGEKVQLAASLDQDRWLSDDAIERALECLKRFAGLITNLKAEEVRIVGTQVLRKARNRQQLIWPAQRMLGHDVEIISGHEEARLIYLGVSHRLPKTDEKRLVVDIGGGSTEFIVGRNFESLTCESISLGCVSFTKSYFANGVISSARYAQAYTSARLKLLELEPNLLQLNWDASFATSGTAKAIGQVCGFAGLSENGAITKAGIKWQKKYLLKAGDVKKLDLKGVKDDRRSIYPAGLVIMEAIFDSLDLDSMQYCDWALREGVIYDLLGRNQQEDVRIRTLRAMSERSGIDIDYAKKVIVTALDLLNQVKFSWNLEQAWQQNILDWVAQIHEIGRVISHNNYHKHGAYLIKHADLAGFSLHDQQMLALIIRYQKGKIKLAEFEDFDGIKLIKNSKKSLSLQESLSLSLLKLCILLRLSIVLNHARQQLAVKAKFHVSENNLFLEFADEYLVQNPLIAADLTKEAEQLSKINFNLIFS